MLFQTKFQILEVAILFKIFKFSNKIFSLIWCQHQHHPSMGFLWFFESQFCVSLSIIFSTIIVCLFESQVDRNVILDKVEIFAKNKFRSVSILFSIIIVWLFESQVERNVILVKVEILVKNYFRSFSIIFSIIIVWLFESQVDRNVILVSDGFSKILGFPFVAQNEMY